MVRCFSQLQEIEICGCGVMSALIAKLREDEIQIGDVTMDIIEFSQLCSLDLRYLQKLLSFSGADFHILFNDKV